MKAVILLASLTAAMSSAAQSNDASHQESWTTNWVKPDGFLRVYQGTNYYVNRSKLWKKLSDWEHIYRSAGDDGRLRGLFCKVNSIKGKMIIVDIYRQTIDESNYSRIEYGPKELVKNVALVNYPSSDKVVTGDAIDGWCIPSTNFVMSSGVSLRVYDFGIQATNLIPVVSRKKVIPTAR